MTDFKKGDRVRHSAGGEGTYVQASGALNGYAIVRFDGESERAFTRISNLTKITDPPPLRFEDVRTGDKITVEVRPKSHPPYTVTGYAHVKPSGWIGMPGAAVSLYALPDGRWYECDDYRPATLTAHEPDEAWKRAKVIKADIPTGGRVWLLQRGGNFGGWAGHIYEFDELTNVKIIVDEHGKVQK